MTKRGHRLACRGRQVQCFPYTVKDIALCNPAGIALINGAAERRKFRFILPLLAFQCPERGAYHFTGAFVASGLDLFQHEALQFFGQIHISSWQGNLLP